LKQLLYIEVNVNKFNPLRASSYIPLPDQIVRKKAIVNVQNDDEFCFGWAVTSAICEPTGLSNRTSSYPDCRRFLQFKDIEFPVRLRDISKFEKYNPQLSINVYGLEQIFKDNVTKYEVVGPLHYSSNKNRMHVNLLLVTDEEGNSHYCWIKDLSRLVSQQVTSRDGAKHFCDGCLHYFRTEPQLTMHQRFDCNHVYTKLPTTDLITNRCGEEMPGNILKFENYSKQLKVPFVIYADFETLLTPVDTGNQEANAERPYTVTTCEHKPYSFAYFLKCSYDDNLSKFEIYRGENAVDVFVERLDIDMQNIYSNCLKHVVPMKAMVPAEIQNFADAVSCHICDKPFEGGDVKVRDHDHLTGDYRGAAHSNCNLNYQIPNFVPVFFHNLNYDSHLFVKQLAQNNEEIDVIPVNKEKYISFGKRLLVDEITVGGARKNVYMSIRFLDSFRFLSSSLAKLADTLSDDQCFEIRNQFGNGIEFELMRQKGVFPYSYTNSFQKLDEPALPTNVQFYDPLTESHILPADYDRAVKVWETFRCQTLGDYSDVYLKCDVFILADVFENFRNLSLQQYKLDPAQYYTAPGLFWDAMLRNTGVELELLTDMDMLHFFRKGIRGGVSTCVGRKAIANNQFAGNYDPSKPTSFIMYLDATNLYGFAMRQHLPQSGFVWMTDEEIDRFDVFDVLDDSDTGYVLEVDLHYPPTLHDAHNDLPFCPELIVPPEGKFKNSKLIPNLHDKSKYVIHYRNLKQCLQAGLVLTRTHRILKFTQSAWLRPYIDLNTKLRNDSTNEFHRSLFKLGNNGVFGKTMENVDKRVVVKLVSHWEKIGKRMGAESLIAKSNFKDRIRFGENLIAVEMNRTSVYYNKPSYVGFSVLDISKTVLYEFYYDYLKHQYDTNVRLLYTDTDSLILEIKTENFYADMKQHLQRFDTSNYKTNLHGIPKSESVVGKIKDEYAGVAIRSFYGVGAKTYCVNAVGKIDKKAKGVKHCAVRKYLTSEIYQSVAENRREVVFCQMYVFRSRLHTMYTELMNKVALSSSDDKRYLIPDSTKTLAWGHQDIQLHKLLQAAANEI
jgi:hypothetical protein